jgi:hypothetical protein
MIRLLESPARQALPGTAAHLAEKSYLAGKATTFPPVSGRDY